MSKRVIVIIIIFSSVSLIAAIITQLFWAKDAVLLKQDQFSAKVDIVLKSVVNQLLASNTYGPNDPDSIERRIYPDHFAILSEVDPKKLDSLLQVEMESMRINRNYVFGVFRLQDTAFVMGNYGSYRREIISSGHQVSLSCLCEDEQYFLSVYFPYQRSIILSDMIILPVMSGLFLLVLVFSFFFTIYSLLKQKKLSEMKTDFVNNMTHEFKTPISTISASSEMLIRKPVIGDPDKIKKYARIIFDENLKLKNQVERILQIATVEKGDVRLRLKDLNIHEIIKECSDNFRIQVQEREGSLNCSLHAHNTIVKADRYHLVNIFNNLLDNANKYSPEKPDITISTMNENGCIRVDIRDKGIGIRKEERNQIFKKFHRLQSGDIHDVKGFGIGLYYVKKVVEEMNGKISVNSEKSKGSIFTVEFPVY